MMVSTHNWTYGAEHELADWPLDRPMPAGFKQDTRDYTIVNSNGIAADPKGKLYRFGGEFNTPPTGDPYGQVLALQAIKDRYPEATVNYRSNLHIHVRVPGLKDDLTLLKRVQLFIHEEMPKALLHVQELPRPTAEEYPRPEELDGALRRWRRRRVSHQTLLTPARLWKQLEAKTVEEFFAAEVPHTKEGVPQWHLQPRLCVNLRQMRETDTVEFRHFAGTLDEGEMLACVEWCRDFLRHALVAKPLTDMWEKYPSPLFPAFPKYVHWMENNYRSTVCDGTVPKDEIAANIKSILESQHVAHPRTLSR